MNWWEWTLVAVTAWTLLVTLLLTWNHRVRMLDAPRVCSGCQRHYLVVGCPVHDRGGPVRVSRLLISFAFGYLACCAVVALVLLWSRV